MRLKHRFEIRRLWGRIVPPSPKQKLNRVKDTQLRLCYKVVMHVLPIACDVAVDYEGLQVRNSSFQSKCQKASSYTLYKALKQHSFQFWLVFIP